MIISNKTSVGFEMPKEFNLWLKFREEHKDWVEYTATNFVTCVKEQHYKINVATEDDNIAIRGVSGGTPTDTNGGALSMDDVRLP